MKKLVLSLVLVLASVGVVEAKTLSVGSSGLEVSQLQTWLINNGYPIPLIESGVASKGYFGSQTEDAVKMYQEDKGFDVSGEIETGSYSNTPKLGAVTGPDYYNTLNLRGGVLFAHKYATSTAGGTMRVSDIAGWDTIILNPTGAASGKTLTFFASSSAKSWLPEAGDRQRTCFLNATTTDGVTITFAAGTGIDLEVSTSTGALALKLDPNNTTCIDFIRKVRTSSAYDITAAMTTYTDGD